MDGATHALACTCALCAGQVLHSQRRREKKWEDVHECFLMIGGVACAAGCINLRFIIVPLTLAFFLTYLLAPLLDLLEHRPMGKCTEMSSELCRRGSSKYGGVRGTLTNFFLLGKLPHSIALLATLIVTGTLISSMCVPRLPCRRHSITI